MPGEGLSESESSQAALADPEAEELLDAAISEVQVDRTQQGSRLDQCLSADERAHSRAYVQGLIAQGAVSVDGVVCTQASRRVRLGQCLSIEWRLPEAAAAFVPERMSLPIVYEDSTLLVVNKAAGMVVHPAAGNWRGTLMNGLLAHHALAASLPRAGIVHRLDKDTSGLMVVAKTLECYHALVRAISARQVQREYLALCHGRWSARESVEAPIGRDPRSRVRMAVVAGGRSARTDFTPLAMAERFSLMHCKLHTGRTHQIRVHAASRRHPLVADGVYGGAEALGLSRQALHAARLGLNHPTTGEFVQWAQPLPDDLAVACRSLWADLNLDQWL